MDEVGAAASIAKTLAGGFDSQTLAHGPKAESAGQAIVLKVKVAVLEFHNLAAINTDEVVVIGVVDKVWIVSGLAVAEFDFVDEVCFHEESEGSVNGRAGGAGACVAEAVKEFFRSEVLVGGEDDFENFIPLGGLP